MSSSEQLSSSDISSSRESSSEESFPGESWNKEKEDNMYVKVLFLKLHMEDLNERIEKEFIFSTEDKKEVEDAYSTIQELYPILVHQERFQDVVKQAKNIITKLYHQSQTYPLREHFSSEEMESQWSELMSIKKEVETMKRRLLGINQPPLSREEKQKMYKNFQTVKNLLPIFESLPKLRNTVIELDNVISSLVNKISPLERVLTAISKYKTVKAKKMTEAEKITILPAVKLGLPNVGKSPDEIFKDIQDEAKTMSYSIRKMTFNTNSLFLTYLYFRQILEDLMFLQKYEILDQDTSEEEEFPGASSEAEEMNIDTPTHSGIDEETVIQEEFIQSPDHLPAVQNLFIRLNLTIPEKDEETIKNLLFFLRLLIKKFSPAHLTIMSMNSGDLLWAEGESIILSQNELPNLKTVCLNGQFLSLFQIHSTFLTSLFQLTVYFDSWKNFSVWMAQEFVKDSRISTLTVIIQASQGNILPTHFNINIPDNLYIDVLILMTKDKSQECTIISNKFGYPGQIITNHPLLEAKNVPKASTFQILLTASSED